MTVVVAPTSSASLPPAMAMARPKTLKVVKDQPEEEQERWSFSRVGLSYRVVAEEIESEIIASHLKRSGDGTHADIRVITNLEGVKTGKNGLLHAARFNLTSSTTRKSLAKLLEERTQGHDMDWYDGLEMLCQQIMEAESVGQPYEELGFKQEKQRQKYALDPLVPANVASLLYGPGGSGKSILALGLALSVKMGREIVPGIAPALKGNVLYLDWETDAAVINERLLDICSGLGVEPVGVIYRRCFRPLHQEAEEIANAVAEREIVYVVIDSAGMAMGGVGENRDANESTLRLFDAIRHLGVTAQVIDHVSKQEMRSSTGQVVGRTPYGSVYKTNLARSTWEIRNTASEGDAFPTISLFHTKANDSRLHDPIGLEIRWEQGKITFHEADLSIPTTAVPDSAGMLERMINFLRDHPHSKAIDVHRGSGVAYATVRQYLSQRHRTVFTQHPDGTYSLADEEEEAGPYWSKD